MIFLKDTSTYGCIFPKRCSIEDPFSRALTIESRLTVFFVREWQRWKRELFSGRLSAPLQKKGSQKSCKNRRNPPRFRQNMSCHLCSFLLRNRRNPLQVSVTVTSHFPVFLKFPIMEKDYGSKEDCALGSNPSCPPQPNLGEASTGPSKTERRKIKREGRDVNLIRTNIM